MKAELPLILKLKGRVQHYQWGGVTFLPELLGENNSAGRPFAEYWMGIHPLAPSVVELDGTMVSLADLIAHNPSLTLTPLVYDRFGGLPYLFKVLDVKEMLSIQVHPTREAAIKGYERENAQGIPLDAPTRNFKDQNHKPEVMLALSDFWLLHGFRSLQDIEKMLEQTPEFNVLLPLFRKEGLHSLYQFLMEMDQASVNNMLSGLVKRELRNKKDGLLQKSDPGWWVTRLFESVEPGGNLDKGIFSIYLLNLLYLKPGEAIFQSTGILHAYLEGQSIELMSNSDNVFRGGLTPKHIDVAELMANTVFESVVPAILRPRVYNNGEEWYECPVPDFALLDLHLKAGELYSSVASSPEIWFAVEGGVIVNNEMVIKRGEAFFACPKASYTFQTSGKTRLCKAFVPTGGDYSQPEEN